MPQDAVLITELRNDKDKNQRPYLVVIDGYKERWNLFGEFAKADLKVGKAYLFRYERNGEFRNLTSIEPLDRIFVQQALKEVANKNDIMREFTMLVAYSKDLVTAGKIELPDLLPTAKNLYQDINNFVEAEYAKTQQAN